MALKVRQVVSSPSGGVGQVVVVQRDVMNPKEGERKSGVAAVSVTESAVVPVFRNGKVDAARRQDSSSPTCKRPLQSRPRRLFLPAALRSARSLSSSCNSLQRHPQRYA